MVAVWIILAILVFLALLVLLRSLRVIPEYERAVYFRLGRLKGTKGPGLVIVWPIIDRIIPCQLAHGRARSPDAGAHHAATT